MSKALVRFDLPDQKNKQIEVLYNSPYLDIDDEEVKPLFNESIQPKPTKVQIHYAKVVLKQPKYKDANNFYVKEIQENNANNSAGAAIIIAFVLAIIFAPLLVILGMHDKFLLKKLYSNRTGQGFKDFTEFYTKIGIGLYGLVVVLIAAGKIFNVGILSTLGIYALIFGGIAYLILSLVLTKKYKEQ